MKRCVTHLAAIGLLSLTGAAEPTTTTAMQPTNLWKPNDLGKLMLRPFATAPYPHASRAAGWKNSAGTVFAPDHYTDSTVGIFVPNGFKPGGGVNLIVYFHGHRNHVSQVIDTFKLEEQIAKSGVNAILVVPQGPLDVPDSGGGKLEHDDDAFERFVVDVSTYLEAEGITPDNRIGNIALVAHSGGYNVTAAILHRGGLSELIHDVILLDATYGGLQWFADFAAAHPTDRIVSFHTKHLDDENIELAKLLDTAGVAHCEVAEADLSAKTLFGAGAIFISTTLAHNDVPSGKDYLALCLKTSRLAKLPAK